MDLLRHEPELEVTRVAGRTVAAQLGAAFGPLPQGLSGFPGIAIEI
jgi:hypothetical protein